MKKLVMTMAVLAMGQMAWANGIEVNHAWARETVQGMSMGGVFMEIQNQQARDDVLVGGSSPVSDKIEVHTHINDNGVMRMRELAGGLALPSKKMVALKPGSYHIMLMGLKKKLTAGDTFPLTLHFKHAAAQTISVQIQSNAAPKQHHH